ncbi:hypothetical protein BU17DRAFT_62440 [Hysterangium stoloniferum]|nr:hypothetical protein BU17DRAFT_62440 [Hysterangium stoloniferum]
MELGDREDGREVQESNRDTGVWLDEVANGIDEGQEEKTKDYGHEASKVAECPVDNSSTVTIKVYVQGTLPVDDLVGKIKEKLDELVGTEMSSAVRRPLVLCDTKGNKVELGPSLQFTISTLDLGGMIKSAREEVANMEGLPMLQQADGHNKAIDRAVVKLLQNVKIFTDLVEKMAEVHPYPKAAWSLLSLGYKASEPE